MATADVHVHKGLSRECEVVKPLSKTLSIYKRKKANRQKQRKHSHSTFREIVWLFHLGVLLDALFLEQTLAASKGRGIDKQ